MPRLGTGRLSAAVLLLAAIAACGPDHDARPAPDPRAALPLYEAPDGAPEFCTGLAAMTELAALPRSVGTLAAGADVEARTQLSRALRELRAVRADVRGEGGHDDLVTALDGLVGSLSAAVDGPLTGSVVAAVSDGLRRVGALAQPACGFPA